MEIFIFCAVLDLKINPGSFSFFIPNETSNFERHYKIYFYQTLLRRLYNLCLIMITVCCIKIIFADYLKLLFFHVPDYTPLF